ncbi:MAG: immunoglobulin-like domain-containing protein [Bacilli bacterium]
MKKILLFLLLPLLSFSKDNFFIKNASSAPTYENYVDEAISLEERVNTALEYIDLNIDLNNVVTTIKIPTTGLFDSTIAWSSSNTDVASVDNDTKKISIIRPAIGEDPVQITLTATLTIADNKDTSLTKTREFIIRVLPLQEEVNLDVVTHLDEDFTSYNTGDDVGEYLSWNLNSGSAISEIVTSVPDNECLENEKILKINSTKTSQETKYVRRNFYEKGTFAVEFYTMFWGELNGVYFELGRNDIYGPMVGIDSSNFYCYKNGTSKLTNEVTEGVWYKVRMEINASFRSYNAYLYKMDGSNELITLCSNVAYAGNDKFINSFRIRTAGGDKLGQCYLSSLKINTIDNLPVAEGTNPNRVDGIGKITGFEEDILTYIGDTSSYIEDIEIYNRFDVSEKYVKNTDYTIETSTLSSASNLDVLNHKITLLSTGEVRNLVQNIYKEEETALPYIESFKGSHLARVVVDIDSGTLSSTGHITFTGTVRRKDSTVYYGLSTSKLETITASQIKAGGSEFIKSGSFAQTSRNVEFTIDELSLDYEYFLYVVISNTNGDSEIYAKNNITEVINITTCEEFYDMTVNVNTFKNEFRLLNDLDFTGYDWVCDPTNTLRFKGSFDGQGHTISNLLIESPYRKAAFFFEIGDATIKNLVVTDSQIEGLQDTAVICGYSYGGVIDNITILNTNVVYNGNAGGEGYFAMLVGRVQQNTTTATNIVIDNCYIECNKYTGALTGNVNKGTNAVFTAKNVYCDITFDCDGAAIGLIGRNRGTSNLENVVAFITINFAKKEVGICAGHNKEGGILNVKNLIGSLKVKDITQPTYLNQFIGSQDDNTSSYTYENIAFIRNDYSHISEELIPTTNTRFAGKYITVDENSTQKWWEENTFISCFEANSFFAYDEETKLPTYALVREDTVTVELVNSYINNIKDDYSSSDHYYITRALMMYESLSTEEKAQVNKTKLDSSKAKYDAFINALDEITSVRGGN